MVQLGQQHTKADCYDHESYGQMQRCRDGLHTFVIASTETDQPPRGNAGGRYHLVKNCGSKAHRDNC